MVGGGHNGLVNAGYLAKAGLRTLVLEKRDLVGGAAITEEAHPGFSFTTFSYALSLLRPEIIHELDLVEHGFMPLMMPSSFHPTGDGDYLLLGDDHAQNLQEIRRHSPARRRRLRPLPPRPRPGRPGSATALRPRSPERFRQGPRGPGRRRLAARPSRRCRAEGDARRRPAGHRQRLGLDRGLLRARGGQGLPRLLEHHRHEGRARCRPAPGWCCSSTSWASTTATSARGRSTRAATAGSPRCSPVRLRHSVPRSGWHRRSAPSSRRRAARSAWPSRTAPSSARRWWSPPSTRGVRSSTWSTHVSCPPTWSRTSSG